MSDDFHTRHRKALAKFIRQQLENQMISTVPVGTVLRYKRDLSHVVKVSRHGEAAGEVQVMVLLGQGVYHITTKPTNDFEVVADQEQFAGTPLVLTWEAYQKLKVQQQSITAVPPEPTGRSDGSTASYYQLPANCKELQDLISHRNMNAQMGEIFRATYRFGMASHSDQLRDAKKIKFYIEAEIKRLESQCSSK